MPIRMLHSGERRRMLGRPRCQGVEASTWVLTRPAAGPGEEGGVVSVSAGPVRPGAGRLAAIGAAALLCLASGLPASAQDDDQSADVAEPCEPAQIPFDAENLRLTGNWGADDDGVYYIRQVGNTIWWTGMSGRDGPSADLGRDFDNVAHGTLKGNVLGLEFADVPRGNMWGQGHLSIRAEADEDGNLQLRRITGDFGAHDLHPVRTDESPRRHVRSALRLHRPVRGGDRHMAGGRGPGRHHHAGRPGLRIDHVAPGVGMAGALRAHGSARAVGAGSGRSHRLPSHAAGRGGQRTRLRDGSTGIAGRASTSRRRPPRRAATGIATSGSGRSPIERPG